MSLNSTNLRFSTFGTGFKKQAIKFIIDFFIVGYMRNYFIYLISVTSFIAS